jgi:hypothetical protein
VTSRSVKALLLLLVLLFSGATQLLTLGESARQSRCKGHPAADQAAKIDHHAAPAPAEAKPHTHCHSHSAKKHSHAPAHVEKPSTAARELDAHCSTKAASPCGSDCQGGCIPGERCCCEPGKPTNGQLCYMKAGCGGPAGNNGLFLPALYGWDFLPGGTNPANLRFRFEPEQLPVYSATTACFRARPPTPPPRASALPIS